jgi:hypothetical protein
MSPGPPGRGPTASAERRARRAAHLQLLPPAPPSALPAPSTSAPARPVPKDVKETTTAVEPLGAAAPPPGWLGDCWCAELGGEHDGGGGASVPCEGGEDGEGESAALLLEEAWRRCAPCTVDELHTRVAPALCGADEAARAQLGEVIAREQARLRRAIARAEAGGGGSWQQLEELREQVLAPQHGRPMGFAGGGCLVLTGIPPMPRPCVAPGQEASLTW